MSTAATGQMHNHSLQGELHHLSQMVVDGVALDLLKDVLLIPMLTGGHPGA